MAFALNPKDFESHEFPKVLRLFVNLTDISLHSLLLSLEIYTNSKFFYGKDLIVSTRNFVSLSTSWS